MDIHGFQIVSEPSPEPPSVDHSGAIISDGHITTVTDRNGESRGPFNTVAEAVRAAHAWHQEIEDAAIAEK